MRKDGPWRGKYHYNTRTVGRYDTYHLFSSHHFILALMVGELLGRYVSYRCFCKAAMVCSSVYLLILVTSQSLWVKGRVARKTSVTDNGNSAQER